MLMVENRKPRIADNKANSKRNGFIKIKQLKVPNTTDKIPDSLYKFIL